MFFRRILPVFIILTLCQTIFHQVIAEASIINTEFTRLTPYPLRVIRESWKSPAWPFTRYYRYHLEWRTQPPSRSPVVAFNVQHGIRSLWGFNWIYSTPVMLPATSTTYMNKEWLYRTSGPHNRIFRVTAIRANGTSYVVGESVVDDPL